MVLFSTHVVEDVAVACPRVLVLSRGEIVYDGEPAGLSSFGRGYVWQLRLEAGEVPDLPEEAVVVDQLPEADGGSRLRILSDTRPHEEADVAEPTLEDGYLALVGVRERN